MAGRPTQYQKLSLRVGAELDKFKKEMKNMRGQMKKTNQASKTMSKAFKSLGGIMAGAFAIGAIKRFAEESVRLADVQLKAEAQLKTALDGNIAAFNDLANQASELQKITLFGDEETIRAQALIAAFVEEKEQIKSVIPLVQDMAAAKGMDLANAADLVSKTLGSSTNALSRYGIEVTGAVGSNERLASLMKGLESAFGGTAEAMAKAGSGPMQQLQNSFGDLREELGKAILPLLNKLATALTEFIPKAIQGFQQFRKWVTETANSFIDVYNESVVFRGAVELIKISFKNVWDTIKFFFTNLWENLKVTGTALKQVFTGQFGEALNTLKTGFTEIGERYKDWGKDLAENYVTAWNNTINPREKIKLFAPSQEEQTQIKDEVKKTGIAAGQSYKEGFNIGRIQGKGIAMPETPEGSAGSAAPEFEGKLKDIQSATENVKDAAEGMNNAFVSGFSQAATNARQFGATVKDIAKQNVTAYIAEGIAGAVKNALAFIPPPFNLIAAGSAGAAAAVLFNKLLPSFDKGTPYVPHDMIAQIHKGEAIIPAHANRGGKMEWRVDGRDLVFFIDDVRDKINRT